MKREHKQLKEQYLNNIRRIKENSSINFAMPQNERIQKAQKDVSFFVQTYFSHYADAESANFHVNFANHMAYGNAIDAVLNASRIVANAFS